MLPPRWPREDADAQTGAVTQIGATGLNVVAWLSLLVAVACTALIAWDIFARGRRQQMAVMNAVWPITALYFGPVGLWAYRRDAALSDRRWWQISKGVAHCGAGCTLGDIVGEWTILITGFPIPLFAADDANTHMAMYALDFTLAWTFGIAFQYFSIAPMREDLSVRGAIWAAVRADTLSIVAFQVGLFAVMGVVHLVLFDPPLSVASAPYWLFMQIGMIAGFATAWPVNAWLIRRGWKEAM